MGISAWYDVFCDGDDCLAWTSGHSTRPLAAKNARLAGWKKTRDGWMCPADRADVCGELMQYGEGSYWCAMKPGHEGEHWKEQFTG